MKRTLQLIVALIAIAGILSAKEVVKIGIIGPFSGDMGTLGLDFKNAAMLAIKEVEGQQTNFKYEFIFEDDQCVNRNTALAINKLISLDKVNAVLTFSAGPGNVVKPVAIKKDIINLNVSFDISIADGRNNFTYTTPPQSMAREWKKLAQEKGWKRIAVVEMVQQGVRATVDAAEQELKGTQIEFIRDFKFIPGERDFRSLVLKVEESKPDAIFVMSILPEIEMVGRRLRERMPSIPLTTIWSFDILREFEFYQGSYFVSTGMPTQEFQNKFKSAYGYTAAGDQLNSYDMIKILVQAYEANAKNGVPLGSQVAKTLVETPQFDSLMGKVHCDKNGVFQIPTSLKKVTQNGLEVIEK